MTEDLVVISTELIIVSLDTDESFWNTNLRVREDLKEVFKWVKDFKRGDIKKVLIVKEKVRTRTNGFKLDKF